MNKINYIETDPNILKMLIYNKYNCMRKKIIQQGVLGQLVVT